jgi:hypothetical protein
VTEQSRGGSSHRVEGSVYGRQNLIGEIEQGRDGGYLFFGWFGARGGRRGGTRGLWPSLRRRRLLPLTTCSCLACLVCLSLSHPHHHPPPFVMD